MLAHLAALLVEDVAETEHGFVRRPVEHQRADRHQRVEPSARLVDRLTDELRGITALELLSVAMWRSPLREGHRARVVPAVDDLRHPRRGLAALLTEEADLVDERPVRVEVGQVTTGVRRQLAERAD